jgi:hypothetical protein
MSGHDAYMRWRVVLIVALVVIAGGGAIAFVANRAHHQVCRGAYTYGSGQPGKCIGSTSTAASTPPQPVALANLNGHQALIITKSGTFNMRSPFMDFLGHPSPQLALSSDVCNYLSGALVSLDFTLTTAANGTKLETMLASLRVTSVKQPVIVGYEFRYTLLGPEVVSLDGRPGPPCLGLPTN